MAADPRLSAYFRGYLRNPTAMPQPQNRKEAVEKLATAAMDCLFHGETNSDECAIVFLNYLDTMTMMGLHPRLSVWPVLRAPAELPHVSGRNYLIKGDDVISTLLEALPERYTDYDAFDDDKAEDDESRYYKKHTVKPKGPSPLLYAIRHCLPLTVRILRKRGARLSVEECRGEGMEALAYTIPEVKEAFLCNNNNNNKPALAVLREQMPYFNPSVAIPNFEGGTALHFVVWRSGKRILKHEIEMLLRMGVDPLWLDANGRTALDILNERIERLSFNRSLDNANEELRQAETLLRQHMAARQSL